MGGWAWMVWGVHTESLCKVHAVGLKAVECTPF